MSCAYANCRRLGAAVVSDFYSPYVTVTIPTMLQAECTRSPVRGQLTASLSGLFGHMPGLLLRRWETLQTVRE